MGAFTIFVVMACALGAAALLRRWVLARQVRRMNRAIHELRRPMQSLAFALGGRVPDLGAASACLEQASFAVDQLDAEINLGRCERVAGADLAVARLGEVTRALDARWRLAGVSVHQPDRDLSLRADPHRLGAAIDNLVANALRHGSGHVEVRTVEAGGVARIEVTDDGPTSRVVPIRRGRRHGHGLRVVGELASEGGGTFAGPAPSGDGHTRAALTFPVAGDAPSG